MPISLPTVKRLFAKSQNVCAMPRCQAHLVIGKLVIAEICHIRARRKNGPRYDPTLSVAAKDGFDNLLLLCPTHHTMVDKDPERYTAELLADFKEMREREGPDELTEEMAFQGLLIWERHVQKSGPKIKASPVNGDSTAVASGSSVAVSIGGHNQAPINIRFGKDNKGVRGYPANSIGADANLSNYVEYLCDLYVKYMSPIDKDEDRLRGKLGRHIKTKFRLRKRTRNDLAAEHFPALVEYLIHEKLAQTPVGQKHIRSRTSLCSGFDEWRIPK